MRAQRASENRSTGSALVSRPLRGACGLVGGQAGVAHNSACVDDAWRALAPYTEGQSVMVRYHPRAPARSTLRPGDTEIAYLGVFAGSVLLFAALVVAVDS